MARSAERAARLETGIAALSSAVESWKTDSARSDARSQEQLVKALELLEANRTAGQATVLEVRESLTSSASLLAKAIEEWRAEIRFGFGLTEVKLLGAIETLGEQIGQVKGSLEERKAALGDATNKTENRLLRVLEALDEGVSNTERLTAAMRAQIGSTATELSTALAGSGDTMRALISELGGTIQEWRDQVDASATITENKLLLSLEALESGIEHSLTARQHVENKLLASLEEMEHRLRRTEEEDQSRQQKLEEGLAALADRVEESTEENRSARHTTDRQEFENKVFMRLEELGIKVQRTQVVADERQERMEAAFTELSKKVGRNISAGDAAAVLNLHEDVRGMAADLQKAAGIVDSHAEIQRGQERLEGSVTGEPAAVSQAARRDLDRVVMSLDELAARIAEVQEEGALRHQRVESSLAGLAGSVEEWQAKVSDAGRKRYQRQEGAPLPEGPDPQPPAEVVLEALDDLGNRIAESQQETEERQQRLEVSLTLMDQNINDWRDKNRDAANRNKELMAQSLEALENRIVKIQDVETTNHDRVRRELAALTEAVGKARANPRNYATLMPRARGAGPGPAAEPGGPRRGCRELRPQAGPSGPDHDDQDGSDRPLGQRPRRSPRTPAAGDLGSEKPLLHQGRERGCRACSRSPAGRTEPTHQAETGSRRSALAPALRAPQTVPAQGLRRASLTHRASAGRIDRPWGNPG